MEISELKGVIEIIVVVTTGNYVQVTAITKSRVRIIIKLEVIRILTNEEQTSIRINSMEMVIRIAVKLMVIIITIAIAIFIFCSWTNFNIIFINNIFIVSAISINIYYAIFEFIC